MRRFELVEGKSSKFWEISRDALSLTVRFGRIGTNGQTQLKSFDSEAAAETELGNMVRQKTKKGYVEQKLDGVEEATPAEAVSIREVSLLPVAKKRGTQRAPAHAEPPAQPEPGWIDAGNGYWLALRDGKIACRKGAQALTSIPKSLKDGEAVEALIMLKEWLALHERECVEAVDNWMLRTLAVPRTVLESVWADSSWRGALENAVVTALDGGGRARDGAIGFFRGVSERGLGLVNGEGETVWVDAQSVAIPHPVLIEGLDDLRALATELSMTQGIQQLFREVFEKNDDLVRSETTISSFRNGKFQQLNHCLGRCRTLGYRVRGGSATVRVWERASVFEARYWIGSDDPAGETWTGDLSWVDERERVIPVHDVPPVAFSEGMRMAAGIYAARRVEEEAQHG